MANDWGDFPRNEIEESNGRVHYFRKSNGISTEL